MVKTLSFLYKDSDSISGHGSHMLLSAAKREKKIAEEFPWYDSILFTKKVSHE